MQCASNSTVMDYYGPAFSCSRTTTTTWINSVRTTDTRAPILNVIENTVRKNYCHERRTISMTIRALVRYNRVKILHGRDDDELRRAR